MKTILDIGSKYGKWTVLSYEGVDSRRRRRYLCQCACGVKESLAAAAVAIGRTKSCQRCTANDLTGKQFGFWSVLRRSNEKSNGTGYKTKWICVCKCGRESSVERCNLIGGKSKGCWICRRGVIETDYFPRAWYRKLLEQSKQRGIAFTITEKELWGLWLKQDSKCSLTGLAIQIVDNFPDTTASVDRIDSNKGYLVDNIWFVHKHINMMKYSYQLDYFIEMCHCVTAHNI